MALERSGVKSFKVVGFSRERFGQKQLIELIKQGDYQQLLNTGSSVENPEDFSNLINNSFRAKSPKEKRARTFLAIEFAIACHAPYGIISNENHVLFHLLNVLLNIDVDINRRHPENNKTALHYAVSHYLQHSDPSLIHYFLANGAINLGIISKDSPAHLVRARGGEDNKNLANHIELQGEINAIKLYEKLIRISIDFFASDEKDSISAIIKEHLRRCRQFFGIPENASIAAYLESSISQINSQFSIVNNLAAAEEKLNKLKNLHEKILETKEILDAVLLEGITDTSAPAIQVNLSTTEESPASEKKPRKKSKTARRLKAKAAPSVPIHCDAADTVLSIKTSMPDDSVAGNFSASQFGFFVLPPTISRFMPLMKAVEEIMICSTKLSMGATSTTPLNLHDNKGLLNDLSIAIMRFILITTEFCGENFSEWETLQLFLPEKINNDTFDRMLSQTTELLSIINPLNKIPEPEENNGAALREWIQANNSMIIKSLLKWILQSQKSQSEPLALVSTADDCLQAIKSISQKIQSLQSARQVPEADLLFSILLLRHVLNLFSEKFPLQFQQFTESLQKILSGQTVLLDITNIYNLFINKNTRPAVRVLSSKLNVAKLINAIEEISSKRLSLTAASS